MIEHLTFLTREGYFELVRTMEYMMPGSDQPILNECLDDVDKCDIYILIIGKRYGSIEQTTNLSFTENEYNRASSTPGKIILSFIAEENALGLEAVKIDDLQRFDGFKGKVKDKYQTFMKNFTSPFHLTTQLVLSLFKFADKKWDYSETLKYYCDRKVHFADFIRWKERKKLNVFTVCGKTHDRAENFNYRMARLEFGMEKEYNNQKIKPADFFTGLFSERFQSRIMTCMMERFFGRMEDQPSTLEACFEFFVAQKIQTFYMQFFFSYEDSKDKKLVATLKTFLSDLNVQCVKTGITFFVVIVFEFDDNKPVDVDVMNTFKMRQKKFAQIGLVPLNKVKDSDIREWAETHLLPPGSNELDRLMETFYNIGQDDCNMKQAESIMSKILESLKRVTQTN